jgi:DNA-binding MarR family transcriptional regulator
VSEDIGVSTGETAAVAKEIKIEDLIAMVGNMNRFLALLGNVKAFSDTGLGMAEWLVLGTVSSRPRATSKSLSRSLGIAPQRANQIVGRLKERELLSQEDQEDNALSLSENGTAVLLQLNTGLQSVLIAGLSGKERSFFSVGKHLKHLIQIVASAGSADEA